MQEQTTWLSGADKPTSFTTLSRLTIFLSWIGIHRFYVGKYYTGSLLIILFFTTFTLEQQGIGAKHLQHYLLLLAQMASLVIQMHDLFKVAFGGFTDENGIPVVLTVDSPIRSSIQFGPLLIWACFFGVFGGHNFYAKKYQVAFLQLITLGGFGMWTLYEIIMITGGHFKDAQGHPVAHIYCKDPHLDVI